MALFADVMEDVARRLLGEPNPALSRPHRLRWGKHGSLEVDTKRGIFYDHEAGVGGGVIGLLLHKGGYDKDAAIEWLRKENFLNGAADTSFVIDETYDYTDEEGELLYQVVRLAPKDFRQRRPDGFGGDGWVWKLGDVRRVIYRLPDALNAIARQETILVPEGEKDVNNLVRLGYSATCNSGGAGEWKQHHSEALKDADILLLPDADEAGWRHINKVGASLTGVAKRIRVLMLPNNAKDVSDWLAKGGTKEQLNALIFTAPDWKSPEKDEKAKFKAEADEQSLLDELAKLDNFSYAKRRTKAAKDLGVRGDDLDEEVQRRREDRQAAPLYGHWITDPWPEVAEGDALLRDIILRIKRHVVCDDNNALTVALWLMFSWVHDEVAVYSPILLVTSAEPACGKSTLMGVMKFLMSRCIASVEITQAALYRSITKWRPSFGIDEFDDVMSGKSKSEGAPALRSVINSGHTRGVSVVRCNDKTNDPECFDTFAPKAIGMVGTKMPSATLSRCVIVRLKRKKRDEPAERFEHIDDPSLAELRSRLARWAADNEDTLRGVTPAMPVSFEDRQADNWRVQLAIADLCGGDYGNKARAAALAIEGKADSRTLSVQLLADIKRIFDEDGGDAILSATLVQKLCEDQEGPWVEFSRGKPLTQAKLARLLRDHHIITMEVTAPVRGMAYRRADFEEPWERYLGSA